MRVMFDCWRPLEGRLHDHGLNITRNTHIAVTISTTVAGEVGTVSIELGCYGILVVASNGTVKYSGFFFPADIVVAKRASGSSIAFEILGGL